MCDFNESSQNGQSARKRRRGKSESESVSAEGGTKRKQRCMSAVMTTLRSRLKQLATPVSNFSYREQHALLSDLVQRSLNSGESNSVLLIGRRGTGKSRLLWNVMKDVKKACVSNCFSTVHLNGYLQTDDKIALKEIIRQLTSEETDGGEIVGSFAQNLVFMLETLRDTNGMKGLIVTLEEFDMFAQHRSQTLIYNLFDICQSAKTPLCVIGISSRFDVLELLEKRVRSRFSHRQIYVFDIPRFSDYLELCGAFLSLGENFIDQNFAKQWNDHIQVLLKEETVVKLIERQYSMTTELRQLVLLLTSIICRVSPAHPTITVTDFVKAFQIKSMDCKSTLVHGMSILELCLLIAIKHIEEVYDGAPFNFEMIYSEYSKFAKQHSCVKAFNKAVVMKAFEHLVKLEMIRADSAGGSSRVQKEYRPMTLLLHPTEVMDALQKFPNCPTEVRQWASRSL